MILAFFQLSTTPTPCPEVAGEPSRWVRGLKVIKLAQCLAHSKFSEDTSCYFEPYSVQGQGMKQVGGSRKERMTKSAGEVWSVSWVKCL